jgi:transcriptional regulator with PAS, ATPase and Fis domain
LPNWGRSPRTDSALPVLILGETGTGKELLARALHAGSSAASRAFVAVNCGLFSETLLESELFGPARGAFTGAAAAKRGLVEAADGGTL